MKRRPVLPRRTALEWRLFAEAVATLIICRARLYWQDFPQTSAWAVSIPSRARQAPIDRLAWSVEAAANRISGATCLCKALALQRMLARGGHDSELRIGVSKSGEKLMAHAWLTHKGDSLIGGAEAKGFTLLAASDKGDLFRNIRGTTWRSS